MLIHPVFSLLKSVFGMGTTPVSSNKKIPHTPRSPTNTRILVDKDAYWPASETSQQFRKQKPRQKMHLSADASIKPCNKTQNIIPLGAPNRHMTNLDSIEAFEGLLHRRHLSIQLLDGYGVHLRFVLLTGSWHRWNLAACGRSRGRRWLCLQAVEFMGVSSCNKKKKSWASRVRARCFQSTYRTTQHGPRCTVVFRRPLQ